MVDPKVCSSSIRKDSTTLYFSGVTRSFLDMIISPRLTIPWVGVMLLCCFCVFFFFLLLFFLFFFFIFFVFFFVFFLFFLFFVGGISDAVTDRNSLTSG